MKKYFITIILLIFIKSQEAYSQLSHQHADGTYLKYTITSFQVMGDDDLPGLGILNFPSIYFVEKEGKWELIIDTPENGHIIEGEMDIQDGAVLAKYPPNDSLKLDSRFTISNLKFKKSPWEKLNLKTGFFHFVTYDQLSPIRFLSYLCLNLAEPKMIRIAGYLSDNHKE